MTGLWVEVEPQLPGEARRWVIEVDDDIDDTVMFDDD